MLRSGAYGFLWLITVILLAPYQAAAHREIHDSARVAAEVFEPEDYDYILPAEARSGIIPFTRAGNLIILQAKVDSMAGNFILDTGAPGLILNLTYFRYYKALPHADKESGGITGGASAGSPTLVKSLSFGPFDFSRVQADRVSLGHIENSKGIKILGLLGAGLFKRFEMMIDYANNVIHLHRAGIHEKAVYRSAYLDNKEDFHILPIRFHNGKLLTRWLIGGQKLDFVLDTGAETNVLDSRLSKDVFSAVEMERKIVLVGTGSKKKDAWYGRIRTASIGTVQFSEMEVLITSLQHMSAAFGRNIDGMLGYSFLSRQKVVINFLTNELYIWK